MMTSAIGYLLSEDSYIWTRRGIVKVKELNESDYVLGLNLEKREVTFEKVESLPFRLGSNRALRITTDVNELLVSEETQLYTAGGKKTAINIFQEDMLDIFYRPRVFSMVKDFYGSHPRPNIVIDNLEIPITDNFAYLLGTQAIVPYREAHRLVLYLESGLNYRKICQILKQALQEIGLPHRILYRTTDLRKIIVYDDSRENSLTRKISQFFENHEMPEIIRVSPTSIIKQFIEGVLDSRAKISRGGLVKFYMQAPGDKIRRFIFSALALFGIQPRYTFVNETQEGLKFVSIYLALPKERPFDLKSLAIASEELLAEKTREDVKVYSAVKHMVKLRRGLYLIPRVKEHWDLISDLALIHHQTINNK